MKYTTDTDFNTGIS